MTNSLKILASLGCLLAGCDATSVDPIQVGTKTSVGIGGGTAATGGASTTTKGSTGPATGGAITSTPKGGSNSGGTSSTSSGTGGAVTYSSCLIVPNPDTGWVDGAKNDCKIQGAWYVYSDCTTSPDDCTQGQEPTPGATTGIPNTGGVMCTRGTTVPTGTDYTKKWGAGIGLNLNQQQPGDSSKNPISLLSKPIKGFTFTLSGPVVPGKINVKFPTPATENAAHFKEITAPGTYQALFSDAVQPNWVDAKVDLVPGNVVSVEFQVVASPTDPVPFDFCVERLSALY